MSSRQRTVILIASIAISLTLVSAAAAVVIREGKGAGRARLGQTDSRAAGLLGRHGALQRDPNYGSRIVYWINFGKRMKDGRYPCEMASNAGHRVFQFSFNSSAYVTSKGIRVGSREEVLTARYARMKRIHTTRFNHYVLGSRPFTDFWVLNATGRVYQIVVRSK
ncbi:MAG: hypothetical protein ACYDHO_05440 [Gaiellaceae bacterium]